MGDVVVDMNKRGSNPPIVSERRRKNTREPDLDVEEVQSRSLSIEDEPIDDIGGRELFTTVRDFIPVRHDGDVVSNVPREHKKVTTHRGDASVASIPRPSSLEFQLERTPAPTAATSRAPSQAPIAMNGYIYQPDRKLSIPKKFVPPPPRKRLYSGAGLSDGLSGSEVQSVTSDEEFEGEPDESSDESIEFQPMKRSSYPVRQESIQLKRHPSSVITVLPSPAERAKIGAEEIKKTPTPPKPSLRQKAISSSGIPAIHEKLRQKYASETKVVPPEMTPLVHDELLVKRESESLEEESDSLEDESDSSEAESGSSEEESPSSEDEEKEMNVEPEAEPSVTQIDKEKSVASIVPPNPSGTIILKIVPTKNISEESVKSERVKVTKSSTTDVPSQFLVTSLSSQPQQTESSLLEAGTNLSTHQLSPKTSQISVQGQAMSSSSGKRIDHGEKDFLRSNALAAIRIPPKVPIPRYVDHYRGKSHLWCPSGLARFYIYKPDYGRVPKYIKERMRQLGIPRKFGTPSTTTSTVESETSLESRFGREGNEPIDHEFGANYYSEMKRNPAAGRKDMEPHTWNRFLVNKGDRPIVKRNWKASKHCPARSDDECDLYHHQPGNYHHCNNREKPYLGIIELRDHRNVSGYHQIDHHQTSDDCDWTDEECYFICSEEETNLF